MASNLRRHVQHSGRIAAYRRRIFFTCRVEYPTPQAVTCVGLPRKDVGFSSPLGSNIRHRMPWRRRIFFTYGVEYPTPHAVACVGFLRGGVGFSSPLGSNIRRI
jgi:hypothetical protein